MDHFGFFTGVLGAFLPIVVGLVFIAVLGTLAVNGGRAVSRWRQNNASPVLSVSAQLVDKRQQVSRHHNTDRDMLQEHTFTTYYATFQVQSGDRMELQIPTQEAGLLVVGDSGTLTFQGTRYLGFARDKTPPTGKA